jgi:membrane protease YdiL (CAAX protease family)
MTSILITILLIAGINLPVYLELYKHALKNRAVWLRIIVTIVFWGLAIITQSISAFLGVVYLFFTYYRKHSRSEENPDYDVWLISGKDAAISAAMSVLAKLGIFAIHLVYIIILTKLVKYNIRGQEIVEVYANSQLIERLILAIEIVVIAPMVEEYVFRYYLYNKLLAPRMPLFFAAMFSAALFTVVHFNIGGIPTFLGLGLFCTYLYERKGYWAAVIAHGISNLITLFLI